MDYGKLAMTQSPSTSALFSALCGSTVLKDEIRRPPLPPVPLFALLVCPLASRGIVVPTSFAFRSFCCDPIPFRTSFRCPNITNNNVFSLCLSDFSFLLTDLLALFLSLIPGFPKADVVFNISIPLYHQSSHVPCVSGIYHSLFYSINLLEHYISADRRF